MTNTEKFWIIIISIILSVLIHFAAKGFQLIKDLEGF